MADEVNAVPELTKEQADAELKDLKSEVFDIMGKQSELSTQWTSLEEKKSRTLNRIKDLEKLFPAA